MIISYSFSVCFVPYVFKFLFWKEIQLIFLTIYILKALSNLHKIKVFLKQNNSKLISFETQTDVKRLSKENYSNNDLFKLFKSSRTNIKKKILISSWKPSTAYLKMLESGARLFKKRVNTKVQTAAFKANTSYD